ncbi:extracellular solute-binding protein [Caloramator sp. CAR-1]|uniref:ABC transporter substrate-binding protein n=1 Tax=Caloramator sp. CAR-1 TaxID=3062777 RepID=UPI0026E4190F|nr:extracellular solute-binding protein [Caloramator sp. CAR-1]MDO6356026.1 extracellular solute-binding protein [Caloramator sp. CAR-1]
MLKFKKSLSLMLVAVLTLVSVLGGVKLSVKAKASEPVVITYANWNVGSDIEKKIIKAFEATHPNIKIQIANNVDYGNYEKSLTAAAAAGKLPDVIMIPNIPMALTNDWALNIKSYVQKDKEWNHIPAPIRNATYYGNGVYAVPAGIYFMGYFVNDDLFKKYNQKTLPFAPKMQDFLTSIKKLNNPQDLVIGLAEEVQIPEWYPAAVNKKLGWYTWDGSKYNLNDPAFIQGVRIAKDLYTNKYVFDSLSAEQKKKLNAGWYGDAWNAGKIAVRWSGTWDIKGFKSLKFNSRFIGVPGGRTPVVGDFMIISKTTKHPKEAYEFLRYITFAHAGILKRIELDTKGEWTSLPLTTDQSILNKFFMGKLRYPGLKEAYQSMANGIIEGVKIVPGYIPSRWTAPTGIKVGDKANASIGDVIWNSMRGNVNISDYAAQLNKLANQEYQKASEIIKKLTK